MVKNIETLNLHSFFRVKVFSVRRRVHGKPLPRQRVMYTTGLCSVQLYKRVEIINNITLWTTIHTGNNQGRIITKSSKGLAAIKTNVKLSGSLLQQPVRNCHKRLRKKPNHILKKILAAPQFVFQLRYCVYWSIYCDRT